MARKTVEQQLTEVFAPHGAVVRACRASFHDQCYFGASNRIRKFYARREETAHNTCSPPPYYISKRHPWPTTAQMANLDFVTELVATVVAELEAAKQQQDADRAAYIARAKGNA